jgi:hypothetical protein
MTHETAMIFLFSAEETERWHNQWGNIFLHVDVEHRFYGQDARHVFCVLSATHELLWFASAADTAAWRARDAWRVFTAERAAWLATVEPPVQMDLDLDA